METYRNTPDCTLAPQNTSKVRTQMHSSTNGNNAWAGLFGAICSVGLFPPLLVCVVLLANGCTSHDDMEFHPKITGEKSSLKRMTNATAATLSKTNLAATNLTLNPSEPNLSVTNKNRVITLTDPWAGKVAFVNPEARFVILDYSLSQMPPAGRRLTVFRQGIRVGEVKISGQPQDGYIAADITAGDIQTGDETRRE